LGQVIALDYPEVDLAKPESAVALMQENRPALVVNAAAYTAVDLAESQPELAQAVNGVAPGVLAEAARSQGAALIHYSTDYVFDGAKGTPYTEDDGTNPLGVYGSSKLAGECAIDQAGGAYLILRTSWLYSLRGDSFVNKVLRWARQNTQVRVVTDQIGNPTWARRLAETTAQLLAMSGSQFAVRNSQFLIPDSQFGGTLIDWINEHRGLYHLAGSGYTSRLEWARAILRYDPHPEDQVAHAVTPALTADFPTPARRPLFSALDCRRFTDTFGLALPDWEDSLKLALA
jgi:dTDP-4-dehydrorhamnose reductase